MSLTWLKHTELNCCIALCGPLKLKVYETMLGQAAYVVARSDHIIRAGNARSVYEAKAEAERIALTLSRPG